MGDGWMLPFADHLGLVPHEFAGWKDAIASSGKDVLFVEGVIDALYLENIRERFPSVLSLPKEVMIQDYGGIDSLKNNRMLSFVVRGLNRCFITFDLDGERDVRKPLNALGLKSNEDYMALGAQKDGLECIEGLIPERIRSKVFAANPDLVSAAHSAKSQSRNDARQKLKKLFVEEFKSDPTIKESDLKPFSALGKALRRKFS